MMWSTWENKKKYWNNGISRGFLDHIWLTLGVVAPFSPIDFEGILGPERLESDSARNSCH